MSQQICLFYCKVKLQLFLIELLLVKFVFSNISCAWKCLEFHFSQELCFFCSSIFFFFINMDILFLFIYAFHVCIRRKSTFIFPWITRDCGWGRVYGVYYPRVGAGAKGFVLMRFFVIQKYTFHV